MHLCCLLTKNNTKSNLSHLHSNNGIKTPHPEVGGLVRLNNVCLGVTTKLYWQRETRLIRANPVYLGCCRSTELSAFNRLTAIAWMTHTHVKCSFKSPVNQETRKTFTRFDQYILTYLTTAVYLNESSDKNPSFSVFKCYNCFPGASTKSENMKSDKTVCLFWWGFVCKHLRDRAVQISLLFWRRKRLLL